MNWSIPTDIYFPVSHLTPAASWPYRIDEGFIAEFESRYRVDVTKDTQSIDGSPVTQAAAQMGQNDFAVVAYNDVEQTLFRGCSLRDGTIYLSPVFDESSNVIGAILVAACWNPQFLEDIQTSPQPDWLAGVAIQ